MLPLPAIDFRRTPVTLILAALMIAIEAVSTLDESRRMYYYNDLRLGILSLIWAGELWRPFTTTLLHVNLVHAAFNVYVLIIFGSTLENRFGSFRTLGLIVLLGYVSMMPEFVVTNYNTDVSRQIAFVGFSGIGYGLFGILFVGRRYHADLDAICNPATVQLMVGWFFFCILLTWMNVMPVANIAHGAGFAFGVVYGLVAFDRQRRRRWVALATTGTVLVLTTLFYCPGHNGYEHAQRIREIKRTLREMKSGTVIRIQPEAESRRAGDQTAEDSDEAPK